MTDDILTEEQIRALDEHTPGPWRTATHNDYKIVGADNVQIATTLVIQREFDEAVANASLIAAAPALKATVLHYIKRCRELDDLVGHTVVIGPLLDIWDGLPTDVRCADELSQLRHEIERLSDIVEGDHARDRVED